MKVLITGGAGFIGTNCVDYYAGKGDGVVVFDNLSRKGSEKNLEWIQRRYTIEFVNGDLRSAGEVEKLIKSKGPFDLVLHMAAQVAVTTSVESPREDFEINAVGTFNLLEALRKHNADATLIYASTNKVYGQMDEMNIVEKDGRYVYEKLPRGVDEKRNLDFHSPYGCSKGAADQYCRDYNRIYGLKTIVFRQSCIYGYHQFGIEDQGWVAWFCIAAVLGNPITIYGDGKQVRDVLFIDDLIRAFDMAFEQKDAASGNVYNIGGGPNFTLSLLELLDQLEGVKGEKITTQFDGWRPGDQKVFVSDISKAKKELDWEPRIDPQEGVRKLYDWTARNKPLFI